MAIVFYPDGSYKKVKNLGWLLRNWKDVDRFKVIRGTASQARLVAYMRDGREFDTQFASKDVLWNFLKRPVFIGLHVNWFGQEHVISKGYSEPM